MKSGQYSINLALSEYNIILGGPHSKLFELLFPFKCLIDQEKKEIRRIAQKFRKFREEREIAVVISSMDVEDTLDGGSGIIEASVAGDFTSREANRIAEPFVGMEFESEAAARVYYNEYAGRAGFSTRILSSRKSERDGSIISRGLGCRNILNIQKSGNVSNEGGEKPRDGCTAMLLVKRENEGRWVVRKFVRDHNHPLVVSLPKRRPTFDEKDKKIQELTAELRVKKRLNAAYREQLLILMKDVENHNDHLTSKVQIIRDNLKELEARRQELSNHSKPSL